MSENRHGAGKREEIEEASGEKRFIRRDNEGHFTEDQVDVGRSLAADRRQHTEHDAGPGQGDRGDRHQK
jgi:hypothetical protein